MLKIKKLYLDNLLVASFFLRGGFFYLLWFLFYQSGIFNVGAIDTFIINNLIETSDLFLNSMNYRTFREGFLFGIVNSSGVIIGPPCNALSLMALYCGFILSFVGKWKLKVFFIPLGILAIHLLNLTRVIVLIIMALYDPESLSFNHSYTFTLVVYSLIFLMWMYWIRLYTRKK